MKLYLAPLEGITTHIYRNAVEKYFPGTDRYYTPFIAPDQNKPLRTKEYRDVLPENNHVPELIPQILTNNSEHFRKTAEALQEMGYKEINLNFGCPSGTVVTRKRGSGILTDLQLLDTFLEQIFYDNPGLKISVKTRIGKEDSSDLDEIMKIYSKYPLSELIIHPRTQKQFYSGVPDMEAYERCLGLIMNRSKGEEAVTGERKMIENAEIPVGFNGNLLKEADYNAFVSAYDGTDSAMFGRGMIAYPGLIRQIKTGQQATKEELYGFHDEVMEGYRALFQDDKNALFRMKEMWIYMKHSFTDYEKYYKKIRKTQSLTEYKLIVAALFREQDLLPEGPKVWELPMKIG